MVVDETPIFCEICVKVFPSARSDATSKRWDIASISLKVHEIVEEAVALFLRFQGQDRLEQVIGLFALHFALVHPTFLLNRSDRHSDSCAARSCAAADAMNDGCPESCLARGPVFGSRVPDSLLYMIIHMVTKSGSSVKRQFALLRRISFIFRELCPRRVLKIFCTAGGESYWQFRAERTAILRDLRPWTEHSACGTLDESLRRAVRIVRQPLRYAAVPPRCSTLSHYIVLGKDTTIMATDQSSHLIRLYGAASRARRRRWSV